MGDLIGVEAMGTVPMGDAGTFMKNLTDEGQSLDQIQIYLKSITSVIIPCPVMYGPILEVTSKGHGGTYAKHHQRGSGVCPGGGHQDRWQCMGEESIQCCQLTPSPSRR